MKLNCVYATSAYHCIGNDNGLIWDIKDELKYFYEKTSVGKSVLIMGRKTYELIKDKLKPNGREYIIFTKNTELLSQSNTNIKYYIYNNVYQCIDDIYNLKENIDKTFWVIGGKQIYELFEPFVEKIYKSYIHYYHTIDTYQKYIYYRHNDYNFQCISTISKKAFDSISKRDYVIEYKVYERKINLLNYNCFDEYIYLNILNKTINSEKRFTRNGFVYSYFGDQIKYDISKSIPLLTTKKMFIRGIIEELLFFIRGDTNTLLLEEKNVNIWKNNSNKDFLKSMELPYQEGDIGPMYGFQWRHYNTPYIDCKTDYKNCGFDQIEYVLNEIINNPLSRRILMTTYHPTDAFKSALFPCHSLIIQFYIEETHSIDDNNKYQISIQMYQRSADVFLGLPFNICSTSILLYIVCYECNRRTKSNKYIPKNCIISLGDIHLYEEHYEQAIKQLKRTPLTNTKFTILNNKKYDELEYEDFSITNYYSYDSLKAIVK